MEEDTCVLVALPLPSFVVPTSYAESRRNVPFSLREGEIRTARVGTGTPASRRSTGFREGASRLTRTTLDRAGRRWNDADVRAPCVPFRSLFASTFSWTQVKRVRCESSAIMVPKDKAIKRFIVRNIVDSSAIRDIQDACVYDGT